MLRRLAITTRTFACGRCLFHGHVARSPVFHGQPPPVDVNERSVPGPSRIDPCPANKLRMSGLDPIDSCLDDLAIIDADPVILIEIIHKTVVIAVDENV